jgi:plasmid stabilization system protein ParE
MAQIIWAPKALCILEEPLKRLAKDSPKMAKHIVQLIFPTHIIPIINQIDLLASNPFLGNYIAEDNIYGYRQVIQNNFRIIYRTDGIRVFIVAIHCVTRISKSENLE